MNITMNLYTEALISAGFARAPNNIEGLTASEFYAGGPGIMTVKRSKRIILNETGSVDIVEGYFENRVVVNKFLCVGDFLEWVNIHGVKSEPGVPGNDVTNVWD